MTQPQPTNAVASATAANVLDPIQVANIGHMASQAGLSAGGTAILLGVIQETAFNAARDAAVRASMTMLPRILDSIQAVHTAAAHEVGRRIQASQGTVGKGMFSNHTNCIALAYDVARGPVLGRPQS